MKLSALAKSWRGDTTKGYSTRNQCADELEAALAASGSPTTDALAALGAKITGRASGTEPTREQIAQVIHDRGYITMGRKLVNAVDPMACADAVLALFRAEAKHDVRCVHCGQPIEQFAAIGRGQEWVHSAMKNTGCGTVAEP